MRGGAGGLAPLLAAKPRARKFLPKPGETVHWENWDMSDPSAPKKIAEGDVQADKHGLVTVPSFVIGTKGWGSRLALTRK